MRDKYQNNITSKAASDSVSASFKPAADSVGSTYTSNGVFVVSYRRVTSLPCNIRREGGQSLVIGGSSLVILEGKACNPL